MISRCCKKLIEIAHTAECGSYYVCSKCHWPCDTVIERHGESRHDVRQHVIETETLACGT